MTAEEIDRFALVLRECERIREMMALEEAALSGGDDGIPVAAAPPGRWAPVSEMAAAA